MNGRRRRRRKGFDFRARDVGANGNFLEFKAIDKIDFKTMFLIDVIVTLILLSLCE